MFLECPFLFPMKFNYVIKIHFSLNNAKSLENRDGFLFIVEFLAVKDVECLSQV